MTTWTYDPDQITAEPEPEQKTRGWQKPVALGAVGVLALALGYGAGTASTQPELSAAQAAADEAEDALGEAQDDLRGANAELRSTQSKLVSALAVGDTCHAGLDAATSLFLADDYVEENNVNGAQLWINDAKQIFEDNGWANIGEAWAACDADQA